MLTFEIADQTEHFPAQYCSSFSFDYRTRLLSMTLGLIVNPGEKNDNIIKGMPSLQDSATNQPVF